VPQATPIPEELVAAVRDRRAILFTGVGLSMTVGLPSWLSFIDMTEELGCARSRTLKNAELRLARAIKCRTADRQRLCSPSLQNAFLPMHPSSHAQQSLFVGYRTLPWDCGAGAEYLLTSAGEKSARISTVGRNLSTITAVFVRPRRAACAGAPRA
jgi:hypothetical protein